MKSFKIIIGLIIIFTSCNKSESEISCLNTENIGTLSLTSISNEYVPESYSDTLTEIEFISTNGDLLVFKPKHIFNHLSEPTSIKKPCVSECQDSTTVIFKHEISNYLLHSEDNSLELNIYQSLGKTKTSYYDFIAIGFLDLVEPKPISLFSFVTELRNTQGGDISNPIGNTYFEEKELAGEIFYEVWGDDYNYDLNTANVFYKKNFGFVGFIDEAGVEWRIND